MVFDKAQAEKNPLARTTGKNAPLSAPTKKRRGGFHIRPCLLAARQTSAGAYRMRPYGFRFQQRETTPRGAPPLRGGTAHHKKRRGGFHIRPCPLAARQTSAGAYRMRPYGSRFQQRETTPRGAPPLRGAPPATKNVGADSISARARLRQDKPPRAHIECAPTGFVFDKGRKLRAGHRPLRGGTAHHKKRRGGFHIRPCPLAVRQTSAGAYRMRPYGSRFQQRETTPRVAPPLRGDSARHKKHRGGFHIRPCPLAAR